MIGDSREIGDSQEIGETVGVLTEGEALSVEGVKKGVAVSGHTEEALIGAESNIGEQMFKPKKRQSRTLRTN